MTTTVAQRPKSIWDRVLDPMADDVTAGHARYLLRLGFTPADHQRMSDLADKSTGAA